MEEHRRGGLVRTLAALVATLAVALVSAPALARDFSDVTGADWFYGAVQWADSNGVMTGYGDGRFGPDDQLSREQEATVLWRCLSGGAQAQAAGLSDVDQGQYYAEAVNWAVGSGTMTGYAGTGTFGVGRPLTRQELAVVMARVCGADLGSVDYARYDSLGGGRKVAPWAEPSLAWAVQHGVINGVAQADGTRALDPEGTVTRAQMAAVMQNAVSSGLLGIDTSWYQANEAAGDDNGGSAADGGGSGTADEGGSASSTPASDPQADVVYVTPSGKKYHRQGCSTLSRSRTVISMSRSEAVASGRDACKVCKP